MKNIEYLKKELETCKQMAAESNIQIGKIYDIKINTRAKKRWGLCSYFSDGFIIEISSSLLQDNVSENALIDTLMHEVLHTVDGCMNHGKKWKECAKIINSRYGLNIKTGGNHHRGYQIIESVASDLKQRYLRARYHHGL